MATRLYNDYASVPVRYRIIKNSEVIKVGDWIVDEGTGCANADATTEHIMGACVDIVTKEKVSLQSPSVNTGALSGTWASSTKQYTAASDNVTVDFVYAAYVPATEGRQFLATLSAAKGTTTGSNKEGYYLSIKTSDSSKLDEATASTTKAAMQFRVCDPYNQGATTEVVVEVLDRELTEE